MFPDYYLGAILIRDNCQTQSQLPQEYRTLLLFSSPELLVEGDRLTLETQSSRSLRRRSNVGLSHYKLSQL